MKTKLALTLTFAILVGSLVLNVYWIAQIYAFTTNNGDLLKQITGFNSQIADLQKEKTNLQQQLQTQKALATPPKLVTRLGTKDIRQTPYANHPWSGKIRFYIEGEIWNVGQQPAENCALHVILHQGANIANDTYVTLGTIKPGSYIEMSANIYYEGTALTSWDITPEPNFTPQP